MSYLTSRTYRIVGIFQGYKCSWFSLIRHEPRKFITANLILHACIAAKKRYSTKIKTAKTILKGISAKIYTLEIYPLYGILSMWAEVCFTGDRFF